MRSADRTHQVSRERILAGALSLLDSGRCADLTVDSLARSLQMSKSTLYKHFHGKEEVMVALVRDACERAEAEVERALAAGTPSEQLAELARIIGRHGQRLPRAASTEPEKLPPACLERLGRTRAVFAAAADRVVARGVERSEFRCADPRMAAVAFVSAAHAVLADGARRGLAGYGNALEGLPGLFLPGIRAQR